jgi:hypothetical protein
LDNLSDVCGHAADGVLTRILEPKEVEHILKLAQAFWVYNGDPCKEKPHALLTSGNHSNGFVNVGGVIKEHLEICELFAHSLALLVVRSGDGKPGWVVGADTSSTALAGYVANFFKVRHIKMVKTEKEPGKNIQVWSPDNLDPMSLTGYYGLQVEELITTAKSAIDVREGIRKIPLGFSMHFRNILPTIVNRSDPRNPVDMINGSKVLSLLRLPISNFEPSECPYCKAGSVPLKPKEGDNWQRLTAK